MTDDESGLPSKGTATGTRTGTGRGQLACLSVPACRVPLSLFERLAVPADALPDALGDVRARSGADQVCVLSTCERTEVYAWWSREVDPDVLLVALAGNRGVDPSALADVADLTVGPDAVRHLLRVGSGLESFVLGELDIVGQVRASAEVSRTANGGLELQRLLDAAVSTSRRVHRSTGLGVGARSVAATAVDLAAAQNGGALSGRQVLVVGAGQVAAQAVESALRLGADVTVCNRSKRHAQRLVAAGAAVVDLADLTHVLGRVDVAVFATAAPHPLVDAAGLAGRRTVDRLLVLDLCVPRNVDPAVGALAGVRLVDLDDLRAAGTRDVEAMALDVEAAERIVAEEVDRYVRWLAGRSGVVPLRRLRADLEARTAHLVDEEMRRTPEAMRPLVEDRVRRDMRQRAHLPTLRLLEAAAAGDQELVDAIAVTFAATPLR
jgi:glutamyl-tRNA reductase